MMKPSIEWKNLSTSANSNGLVPAVIQHSQTLQVLMLGYMNEEALQQTLTEGKVTFFSRSKNRLWQKGESSGNFLFLKDIQVDCDNDTLLITALPAGPTCHLGSDTCFGQQPPTHILQKLNALIQSKWQSLNDNQENDRNSYTQQLLSSPISRVAQKVGEEAVETVIAAMKPASQDAKQELIAESSDLLYHLLVLLNKSGVQLEDVELELLKRMDKK